MTDKAMIDAIGTIRASNNELWMELLRIAIEAEPLRTRHVLRAINMNDRTISDILEKLAQ